MYSVGLLGAKTEIPVDSLRSEEGFQKLLEIVGFGKSALADAGGRTSDARAVRSDAAENCNAAASGKLTAAGIEPKANR